MFIDYESCVVSFFFFSSRRRHTRCSRDWSSDVCSSDLTSVGLPIPTILVTSEDVSQGKPAPDGYQLGAKRLGLDPAACVVFEDAPAGIAAARAAGAREIALTNMHAARDLEGDGGAIPDVTALQLP